MSQKNVKIIQVLPTLISGDGVGNDVLAMDRILRESGYTTRIYAENIDPRISRKLVQKADHIPELTRDDIMIYHFSTGTELNLRIRDMDGRKIMVYHNVTPARFLEPYNAGMAELCRRGREELGMIKDSVDYCLADSEYNRGELIEAGYRCKIDTLPILIPFADYGKAPNQAVLDRFRDDWTNIVFVGRIVPNKKQEDVIRTFYYYKKYMNAHSRLFLVGSYRGMERYQQRLEKYAMELGLEDVYFTGHTDFKDILAYYHLADLFLCMSEHEGFCIPLVEAMFFHVPIVAYACTGVKETLSRAGLCMEAKDCQVAAEMLHLLVTDRKLRDRVIADQNRRLQDFSYENVRKKFTECLEGFLQ